MQTIAPAIGHLALVDSHEPEPTRLARANDASHIDPQPRVGFTPLDKLALEGLTDDVHTLVTWAVDSATSLIGLDREGARLRMIARAVATERARQIVLEALLDQHLAARDYEAVNAINKVLTGTTRRLCSLVAEHRACCSIGRRDVVVAIAHVDEMHVAQEK